MYKRQSINLALRGILKEHDHVVTSSLEHNAVWRCLKTLEKERNIDITKVRADEYGYTNPIDVRYRIKENTKLKMCIRDRYRSAWSATTFGPAGP